MLFKPVKQQPNNFYKYFMLVISMLQQIRSAGSSRQSNKARSSKEKSHIFILGLSITHQLT